MNRLAIGTVQFGLNYGIANHGGQISRSEAKAMLQLAKENNIDMLDTAVAYGDSETCLGEIGTQDFKVVTKLPAVPENCDDISYWVKNEVRSSLLRLRLKEIYGILLHKPSQLLGSNGAKLFKSLNELKSKGIVKKVGVSIYAPNELDELSLYYDFDLVQAPFNIIDQRLQRSGWLERLKNNDVEIHTRSAFLQGLLLMAKADIPLKFSKWDSLWDLWHKWLEENYVSAVHASLAFPLTFPQIDRVVIGADSVDQLKQIISASKCLLNIKLPNLYADDECLINPSKWNQL